MADSTLDYREFFHASPLARLVLEADTARGYPVLDANKAASAYFDLSVEQMQGASLSDFLEAENSDHILRALGVSMNSQSPVTIQALPRLPGGLRVQSFVINPIMDADGKPRWLDMQARPAPVDQQAIERERDDAISLLASVFDVSEMGITVTDHHGRIVKVNEAFLKSYGWASTDLIGEKFTVLLPEDDHDIGWKKHRRGLNEGVRIYGESRVKMKSTAIANVIISSVCLELSQKRKFMVSTIVDITHLKAMERKLRQAKEDADAANIAKSAFLANMSHELRTPLNAIIGFSDMMINQTLGPIGNDHYREYLGDIHFSANHLLAIINGVLDMSKIEAGKMKLDEEPVDIVGLIESVRRIMVARSMEKDINLTIETEGVVPRLSIDERLIRQVLINLVTNSIKFSPSGKEIEIYVARDDKGLSMQVRDHGVGIPEHLIEEVLQPFGQVNDPSINKGQGTGLGLPLAKAMMELHSGSLTIRATSGGGTTVDCRFPPNRIINT